MKLGAFSVSLAVKDIAASRAFYEKFGFSVFGGDLQTDPLAGVAFQRDPSDVFLASARQAKRL